ncbi:DrmB family protein [Patescibacteria group bacterium]
MKYTRRIRRSQLISPWGIGQIIPFEKEALIVAGLDEWNNVFNRLSSEDDLHEFIIQEARLEKMLHVSHFRLPPYYKEKGVKLYIPLFRFPQWHVCPYCRYMEKLSIFQPELQKCKGIRLPRNKSCHNTPENKKKFMIPVRFVCVCKNGHIEDFPFMEWVHRENEFDENCRLIYEVSGSFTSLAAIKITCIKCNISRNMKSSFDPKVLGKVKKCSGLKPWLGDITEQKDLCDKNLQTVQRGSSNVYFPTIKSSIYIPTDGTITDKTIQQVLENNWYIFQYNKKNGKFDKSTIYYIAGQENINPEKLLKAAEERDKEKHSDNDSKAAEEKFKYEEYNALVNGINEEVRDFRCNKKSVIDYKGKIKNFISTISLLNKLRETRALVGFSRLIPEDQKTLKDKQLLLKKDPSINWLPAISVRGEGIFFELDRKKVENWEKIMIIKERIQKLENNFNKYRSEGELPSIKLTPKLILLHSLSHTIINEMSLLCGYSNASIRERLYCNIESNKYMAGVLIYTSSGDSEGSLGGLVKQGQPSYFENILNSAIEKVKWCSNDPICIESVGQGPGSSNLAACHNCLLLPETSCEEGNSFLDRAMLIGTIENPEAGFFNSFQK